MHDQLETARLISRFANILAEEADRSGLTGLANLLRDAEAEANDQMPSASPLDLEPVELIAHRIQ